MIEFYSFDKKIPKDWIFQHYFLLALFHLLFIDLRLVN